MHCQVENDSNWLKHPVIPQNTIILVLICKNLNPIPQKYLIFNTLGHSSWAYFKNLYTACNTRLDKTGL